MNTLLTISSALLAVWGLTERNPGYLINIQWPSGATNSATFANLDALGVSWSKTEVEVTSRSQDSAGKSASGLAFENAHLEWSTLALADSISGTAVHIHQVYAGATADGDIIVDWFVGELNGMNMPDESRRLTLGLLRPGEGTRHIPEHVLGPAIGVNHLVRPGQIFNIGGQNYTAVAAR